MKKTIITMVASVALLAAGCSGELNKIAPRNYISQDALTAEDMQKLLIGLYAQMESYVHGGWLDHDIKGENFKGGPGFNFNQDVTYMTSTDGTASTRWQSSFTTLQHVNNLVESYQAASRTGDSSLDRLGGVAYYFRALIYYNLVTRFGGVPIMRARTYDVVPISPEAEVWNFITENLTEALALTGEFSAQGRFYVSKRAVEALAARVYLAMKDMPKAAQYAGSVMGDNTFTLAETSEQFAEFYIAMTSSSEVVFALANNRTASYLSIAGRTNDIDPTWDYSPSDERFATLFADDASLARLGDIRQAATFTKDPTVVSYSNRIIKFPNGQPGQQLVPTTNYGTPSLVVSRLGEIYLIRAEALGKTGGGAEVMAEFLSKRYSTSPSAAQLAALTDDRWLDLILDERNRELYAEGFRWYDLKRTGRTDLLQTLAGRNHLLYYPIPQREIDLVGEEAYPQNPGY